MIVNERIQNDSAALQRLASQNTSLRNGYEKRLSSAGLSGLLRLSATESGKGSRQKMTGTGTHALRVSGEDLLALEQAGYVTLTTSWVEITDEGNALVRDMLEWVNSKGKGAAQ